MSLIASTTVGAFLLPVRLCRTVFMIRVRKPNVTEIVLWALPFLIPLYSTLSALDGFADSCAGLDVYSSVMFLEQEGRTYLCKKPFLLFLCPLRG